NGEWPAYDPWGPYFPPSQSRTANPAGNELDAFSAWSQRRADSFPRPILARFWQGTGVAAPDIALITSSMDSGGPGISGVTQLYLSNKASSSNDDPASVLDRNGVAAFSNTLGLRLTTGTGVKAAAIVFPESLQSYRME